MYLRLFALLLIFNGSFFSGSAQNDTISELFRNSFRVFELQRNEIGIYRDAKLLDPQATDFHPASTANIGMGLIALCIADSMKWIDDAESQTLITLKSISGYTPGFKPDRNASGFFRHFIDMNTGGQAWDSEYSSIDTGILMCGSLFAKKYFAENDSIAYYTQILWNSINWPAIIANPITGEMFLTLDSDGVGISNSITEPFNEYIIIAWLAKNFEKNNPGIATELWNLHYGSPENLPKNNYNSVPVLADNPNHFLSSFISQFAYYLCHPFTADPKYLDFFRNARKTDSLWWAQENLALPHKWGLGAGSANYSFGYNADAINNNQSHIYSPHIIAGFLPIYSLSKDHLLRLYREGESVYSLPSNSSHKVLWRKSLDSPNWNAPEIQGVDFSTMLFGLATLPEHLGNNFFATFNDFDFSALNNVSLPSQSASRSTIEVFPVPIKESLIIKFKNYVNLPIQLFISDLNGKVYIKQAYKPTSFFDQIEINAKDLSQGIWILAIKSDRYSHIQKVVKY